MRVLAALLAAVTLGQGPQVQTPPGPSLRGVVVDDATRQPVAGALVLLVSPQSLSRARVAATNREGRFTFANVTPGAYRLRAERDGYLRSDLTPLVRIEQDEVTGDVALTLTPTAVISGRVLDPFGDPASRIVVRAWTTKMVAEARTNDLGEYRLFDLPPGTYLISAEAYPGPRIVGVAIETPSPPCPDCPGEGVGRAPLSAILPTGGFIDPRALTSERTAAVFYPGTTDRSAGTPIKAPAGAQIQAIDLRLTVR